MTWSFVFNLIIDAVMWASFWQMGADGLYAIFAERYVTFWAALFSVVGLLVMLFGTKIPTSTKPPLPKWRKAYRSGSCFLEALGMAVVGMPWWAAGYLIGSLAIMGAVERAEKANL